MLEDLLAFENVTFLGGGLFIHSNRMLKNLEGLNNISTINGNLEISGNDTLVSLAGLESLTYVGREFRIGDPWTGGNPNLMDLTALSQLDSGATVAVKQYLAMVT